MTAWQSFFVAQVGASAALAKLATGLLVVAGMVVLLRGAGGIYWLVPGILLCYTFALSESWVLLIEINR